MMHNIIILIYLNGQDLISMGDLKFTILLIEISLKMDIIGQVTQSAYDEYKRKTINWAQTI